MPPILISGLINIETTVRVDGFPIPIYTQTGDPYQAIQKAVLFASYKIGESGAASGFLSDEALVALTTQ